jgi:signal transduction histidine kinase
MNRLERTSAAAETLSRIGSLDEIIARSEEIAKRQLPCDHARVSLVEISEAETTADDEMSTLRIALPAPNGGRVGWMTARRSQGPAFSADDEAVFEHLARFVSLGVQVGLRSIERDEAAARTAALLSRLHEGVAEFDAGLQFLSVNEAAIRLLHLSKHADIRALNLWDLGPGNASGQFGAACQTAIETRQPVLATARFAGLRRSFDMRAFPTSDGLTVLFNDVTAELEATHQLHEAMRLQAMGQLAGGLAHDVNNMLTIMLGNFETLLERARRHRSAPGRVTAPEIGEEIEIATAGMHAGESANSLIQRLLAYSAGTSDPVGPIDVGASVRSLEPLLQRALQRRISARIVCADDLWTANADPAELESAVLNLVLNAQDAMPTGGIVEIRAENIEVDELYRKVGGFDRTGPYVMVSVIDNGTGMTEDTMLRVFEPFFTTKADGHGAGLGLSMVRRFARQAGGHVLIDSQPGQGTILRIYLPRSPEDKASAAPEVATPLDPAIPAEAHEHILLVEDHPLLRAHGGMMLRDLGYQVTEAAGGEEALALVRDGLMPSLLFTDVTLAEGMTGAVLAEVALTLIPGLPVLFTSGNAARRDRRLPDGAAFLKKPFRRSDLAAAIRATIDGGFPTFTNRGAAGPG